MQTIKGCRLVHRRKHALGMSPASGVGMVNSTTSPQSSPAAPRSRRVLPWVVYSLLIVIIAAGSFGIHPFTQDLAQATDVNNKRINLAGRLDHRARDLDLREQLIREMEALLTASARA
ncbi:MAG: hypothetical protein H7Y06_06790 [Opitutaceae bacterium]|nr:hypothetical protein [Opitutaceae bacterium]